MDEQRLLEAAAIVERPSEHPLAKAVLKRAAELSLPVVEPEHFDYLPGKGVVGVVAGEEIIVGNREFMEERGLDLNECVSNTGQCSQVMVARGGRMLGDIHIQDVCGRNQSTRWRNFARWAFARSC